MPPTPAPPLTLSPRFAFMVTRGSRALGIPKHYGAEGHLERQQIGPDVSIALITSYKLGNGRRVYLSGNRKNIPTIKPGMTFNLHDGNPLHKITIQVHSIVSVTP